MGPVFIPNSRDPYNTGSRSLDCPRDFATGRAKVQRRVEARGREFLGISRHRSGSTAASTPVPAGFGLDLLCCPELQPFYSVGVWIVSPSHVEATNQSCRGDARQAPCQSSCEHAKYINI